MSTMTFDPVYGWGWFQGAGSLAVEVPEPFRVAVQSESETEVEGVIESPHRFAGMKVRLGVRSHSDHAANWNVYISLPGQGDITGFVQQV